MTTSPTFSSNTMTTGCVKWFNNKAGYGFISVKENTNDEPTDIFVHHSSIAVDKNQYKYLVTGEYVSFNIEKIEDNNNKHNKQAKNVKGIDGGLLMCETRNLSLNSQRQNNSSRQNNRGRVLNTVDLGKQWMLVKKSQNNGGQRVKS